ncbi:MAG: hypothetical protein GY856_51565, partial [bacterium]|nr:hypothetical protein [bacterium]
MRVALAERVAHGDLRVVPVLLPGADRPRKESELPVFLRRLTWVRFADDWKDDTALHRLLCGIRYIPPGRREGVGVEVCPYRGLEVFRPQDRRFFFGRDALVERLLDYLEGHRFLAVVGPSGSGKSSVVQAGLVPELDDGETLIEILTPRERPLEELAFALRRCFPEGQAPPAEELLGRLRSSADALQLIARELAEVAGARRVFLVVDQFEELFTQTANDDERRRFVANLLAAVKRSGPTSVILTMRSDFLGHCAVDPNLNVFVEEHLFQVVPMSREEQESAITGPARLVELVFEAGLVEQILDDVKGSPGELPLLQHGLLELYERRDGAWLTLRAYQKIGRIEGALTRRAEVEFKKLDDVEQETLRKMFVLCLVKAGEGTEDTRRRAVREELLALGEDPRIAESVLAQCTDARLLTTYGDEARRDQLVDVAHEALIRKWPRLATWMAEGREEARMVDVLRQGAKEWQRERRRSDYLFHGARLAQAKELLASHGRDLTELESSFVAAANARALRMPLLIAIGVVVALAVAGYLFYKSKNEVERRLARSYWDQSRIARSQGRLLLSLHFLAEAAVVNPDAAVRDSQLIDMEQFQPQFALSRVLVHQDWVLGALFSGDDSRVLTWSSDNTARLWDAATSQAIGPALEHRTTVSGALFNGDDSRILTWSDNAARLWDAVTGEAIGPALEHQDLVWGAVLNGDESRVLTWSYDNTARLWDAATGEAIGPALEHQGSVDGALFNGDESRVLTWSEDNTARLWDAASGEAIGPALEHRGSVEGALFNGDGSRVLTWGEDNTTRLWDAATGEAVEPTLEHQDWVRGALFNGYESRVLTWSEDNTARLWDATTGEAIGPAIEHQGTVLGAMFNGDESRVLTWSEDNTARLWDAATGEAIGPAFEHQGLVRGALFNGDESRILTW